MTAGADYLNGLDDVLSTFKDAETGQRGYIITGEARYLEPFQGARDAVDQKLKHLRELTFDNPTSSSVSLPWNLWCPATCSRSDTKWRH